LIFGILAFQTNAQVINLALQKITINIGDEVLNPEGQNIQLYKNTTTPDYMIFTGGNLRIVATFKYSDFSKSGRSNIKKSGIKIKCTYYVLFNGQKRKEIAEHIFFKSDASTFSEDLNFYFTQGVNRQNIALSFKGTMY